MRLYSKLRDHIIDFSNISENGVYKLYHVVNPDFTYIGSAYRNNSKKCKKGMYSRWVEHYSKLHSKSHPSKLLQKVVDEFGLKGLRFEVLYSSNTTSLLKLREMEQQYINTYDSTNKGYNISPTTMFITRSEAGKKSLSESMIKNNPMYDKEIVNKSVNTRRDLDFTKHVIQYNLKGIKVKEYKSCLEAGTELGIDSSNIYKAASGKAKTSGNHIWIFKNEFSDDLLNIKIQRYECKRCKLE